MLRTLILTTTLAWAMPAIAETESPFLKDDFFTDKTTVAEVEAAIVAGGDILAEDEYGANALHRAIEAGAPLEVLGYLIDKGTPVNQADPARSFPTLTATWSPNTLAVLTLLKERGADLNARNYMQANVGTYMTYAEFDPALITFIKEAGVDISTPDRCNDTALTNAGWADHDQAKWIEALTAEGLDPTAINCEGYDMYMKALSWGDGAVLEALYEQSEDPMAANNAGLSGVLLAAQWGINQARLDFLKAKGYDLQALSPKGENALILSTEYGDLDSLKLLLAEGFDINAQSNDGTTALLNALKDGEFFQPDVVRAIIEAGADINLADTKGKTPLMRLLEINPAKVDAGPGVSDELLAHFVDKGANLAAVDAGGATTLIYAIKGGQPVAVLERLLAAGVDVNAIDSEGTSALMYAADLSSDPAVLELLLEAGADTSVKDVFDDTVAVIAADNKALAGTPVLALLQ